MKKLLIFFTVFLGLFNWSDAQSIISVSPTTVSAGQTLDVTITGSNTHFISSSNTTNVEFGFTSCSGTTVNSILVNNDNMITANVTVPSSFIDNGYYDIEVWDQTDGYIIGDRILNVTGGAQPPITISPDSGSPGQSLTVTITGNGTFFLQGSSTALDFELDVDQRVCLRALQVYSAGPSSNTLATALVTIPVGTPGGYYDMHLSGGLQAYHVDNIFHVLSSVSVNEVEERYKLLIGPNPFIGNFSVEYTLDQYLAVKTEIYDLFGKLVLLRDSGKQSAGKYNLRIDEADLNFTSGVYLLRFVVGDRSVTKRIVMNAE